MDSLLEAALQYAAIGWHVFPCCPGAKNPLTPNGVYAATTDQEQIKEWWTRWPTANVAVACGENSGIVVLDVDVDVDGAYNGWNDLAEFPPLPATVCQRTPRGGGHFLFDYSPDIRNANKFRPGLDIRSTGYYILVSPSVHPNGKRYEWYKSDLSGELPAFPEWLIPEQPASASASITSTTPRPDSAVPGDILARASLYLAECDPAVQGCCGHNKLLYAADRMVNGFLLTDDQAYDLLAREYNPRCSPPWNLEDKTDAKDFRRKISEARRLPCQQQPGWLIENGLYTNDCNLVPFVTSLLDKCKTGQTAIRVNEPTKAATENFFRSPDLLTPPGLLGDLCKWMNRTALIQQPLLSLGASVTLLGSLLGQKVQDSLGSRTNLYCMGVAPSSAGKNHAITCIRNLCAEALCTPILGGEYVASDAAIEERMSRSPVTLFLWDEIGYLLSHIRSGVSKNHAQVISTLMKLYSAAPSIYLGREYAESDKQRTIVHPCCCVYGTATPESFASGLSPEQLQDGWLSRCLVFYSSDRPAKQRDIPGGRGVPPELVEQIVKWNAWNSAPADASELVKLMPSGGNHPVLPRPALLIPEEPRATAAFIDFDNDTVRIGDDNPPMACLWKKGEENARKLAIIAAKSRDFEGNELLECDAIWACELVRSLLVSFCDNIAPEIVSNETEKNKRRLLQFFNSVGRVGANKGDVTRATRWLDAPHRMKLIDDLLMAEEIVIQPDGKAVRYWASKYRQVP